MTIDFIKTIISGMKIWTKEAVDERIGNENNALDLLSEMDIVDPVTDMDGAILIDLDGSILSL